VTAQRLPRGRHGLTREEVERSQRERIFWAMAETMARKGYEGTSVAEVTRAAGVSRESFYVQFDSKADCFMSAMEAAVATFVAPGLFPDPADDRAPLERLDALLARYLDALAEKPEYARMFLIEAYAAGPEAIARRASMQAAYAAAVAGLLEVEDPFVAEVIVAALVNQATFRLAAGDLDGLRALREPMLRIAARLVNTPVR
jgi:AcrR family transcriptional regulator